ncbi:unnamed protein product [Calypogeia fissa]
MNGSAIMRAFANARPIAEEPVTEDENPNAEVLPDDIEPIPAAGSATGIVSNRSLQHVSSKAQRVRVLKWMRMTVDITDSEDHIVSKAVKAFLDIFRAERYQANLMKCGRWWKARHTLLSAFEHDHLTLSHTFVGARKRIELKARPGRGRKTTNWTAWLYPLIREEFERLRRSGLKFSPSILQMVAKSTLLNTPHPMFGPNTVLAGSTKPLIERITPRWVQQFQETQSIVHRTQTGKLQVSPVKIEFIEHSVAYHMGQLSWGFASGELNEDLMENMDETHFIVNMDNKKTLGFRGTKK